MKLTRFAVLAVLMLARTGAADAKAYKGAEVYSRESALYGRMEMRMRMIRGSGLLSTFFTYKNGSEVSGTAWEELDIEVLGKNDAKAWQSNLITGSPRVTSEQVHSSPTSLADGYHTYTLEWTPDYVSWSLDGEVVRKTEGGQVGGLTNAASFRFNVWSSDATGWAGTFDEAALPAYQFVNWIKYYRYDSGQFTLDWTDEFESLDSARWATGNWTFDGNRVDFDPANAVVQDGTLILALTKEGETGFSGTVPKDDDGGGGSGCSAAGGPSPHDASSLPLTAGALALALLLTKRAAVRRRQGVVPR